MFEVNRDNSLNYDSDEFGDGSMKRVGGNRKESSFSKNSFFAETQKMGSSSKMRVKSQVSGMEMEYEYVDDDDEQD